MRKYQEPLKSPISTPRPVWIRRMAVLLVVLLTVTLLCSYTPYPVRAAVTMDKTADNIDDVKDKKKEAEEQINEAQDKVSDLKAQTDDLSNDLSYLNQLSDEQKAQYEKIAGELEAALVAKQDALNLYLESQNNLEQKKKEYSERMSVMFEYQNKSTLEILLESDSLAGFFTNLELISLIGDADKEAIEEMTAAMNDAELKSAYAQQEALDMQTVADQKQAELDELEARIGKTKDALEEKQAELSEWQQKEDELEARANDLDAEIARLQKELAEKSKAAASTDAPPAGSMTWPYPGDYTVYSGFGMRMHPIYKVKKMHTGVDLGGEYGNPIVAAAGGTVIIASAPVAGQNTGGTNYGNYIVIDHGGGVSTLYGHCRDLNVSVGDTVTAGQVIAACGSTGTSTGAHLHFEVRVNGARVDPVPYIT